MINTHVHQYLQHHLAPSINKMAISMFGKKLYYMYVFPMIDGYWKET